MKLREEEFYEQYHQHGGTTIIPTEIFNELYDDATEEIERLNNIIKILEEFIEKEIELYTVELTEESKNKLSNKDLEELLESINESEFEKFTIQKDNKQ